MPDVKTMDRGELTLVASLTGHTDRVWHGAWNPQGTIFASCSSDLSIRLWAHEGERENGKENWVCKTILTEGHARTVRQVAWSPCGRYLASASFDATACVWGKGKAGQGGEGDGGWDCLAQLEGHENEVKGVSWARGGNLLATCGRDKSVWIWEVTEDEDFECGAVLTSHTQDVKFVLWHPHSDLLASCSYDNTIKLFKEDPGDVEDWSCVCTLDSHSSTVWCLDFNAAGDRLVSVGDDKTLKFWRRYSPGDDDNVGGVTPETWKCVCTVSGAHDRAVYGVSWCRLSGRVATCSGDNAVRVFVEDETVADPKNAPSFSVAGVVRGAHDEDVNAVAWNPKIEGLLASVGDDGVVRMWRWKTS